MSRKEAICGGCRNRLPANDRQTYQGYYHCSPECWAVYSEVLGYEFSHVVAFSQVHQLTVDSYALQHAGGAHRSKSLAVHLVGLYAAFELQMPGRTIPGLLQRVAGSTTAWPEFHRPSWTGPLTIFEVALAASELEHIRRVQKWARFVWEAWTEYHDLAADLADCSLNAITNQTG